MRKLYKSYPNYITKSYDMYYSFINTTSKNTRDEVMEYFILEYIFILIFTSRCPSLAKSALCATIFNYSKIISFEFYETYPNLHTFLNIPMFGPCIRSLENNEIFNLHDYSNHWDQSLPKILYDFCEQYEIDYNIATYHLQNGFFYNMCKEKYYNESMNIGRYLVDNMIENVLENLSIKPYEFYQIINYNTNICEYY